MNDYLLSVQTVRDYINSLPVGYEFKNNKVIMYTALMAARKEGYYDYESISLAVENEMQYLLDHNVIKLVEVVGQIECYTYYVKVGLYNNIIYLERAEGPDLYQSGRIILGFPRIH